MRSAVLDGSTLLDLGGVGLGGRGRPVDPQQPSPGVSTWTRTPSPWRSARPQIELCATSIRQDGPGTYPVPARVRGLRSPRPAHRGRTLRLGTGAPAAPAPRGNRPARHRTTGRVAKPLSYASLYDSGWRRYTSHIPFSERPLSAPVLTELAEAAHAEGSRLHHLSPLRTGRVLPLARESQHRNTSDADRAEESRRWVREADGFGLGMPPEPLGPRTSWNASRCATSAPTATRRYSPHPPSRNGRRSSY
jgi:hypothetical protein